MEQLNYNLYFPLSVNCDALTPPVGSSISYDGQVLGNGGYSIDTVATYSCNMAGQQLFNGDTMRTCIITITWNGIEPQCLGEW